MYSGRDAWKPCAKQMDLQKVQGLESRNICDMPQANRMKLRPGGFMCAII